MHKDIWTDRQHMLGKVPFEFFHFLDEEPPTVEFHRHPYYEVFFFLGGNVTYTIEGKTYKLRPGDLLLTNSLDVHRPTVSPGKPYERIVLWLSNDFFDAFPMPEDNLSSCFTDAATKDYRLIRPSASNFIRLRGICDHISKALTSPKLGSASLAYAYVLEFLVRVCRCYYEASEPSPQDITENEKVNAVISYINDTITSELTLDTLANQFFISKFYLSRQFRQYAGISIYQYIIKRRLGIARDLLCKGSSVIDACMECGCGDYSNFLKAFKREFEKSPKEYARLQN